MLFIFALAVNLPPLFAQQVEQIEKAGREIEKEKLLREKIEGKKPKPEIEKKLPPAEVPAAAFEEKILITSINLTGVTLLSKKETSAIILPYKNKELSMRDMQKVADLITDAYRRKGYITSRAYLPPQKIEKGILEIRVMEGLTGDIEIKGNRYFKDKLYRKEIVLNKGQPFNYEYLRRGMSKINALPDRNAKAVITPGKEAGTTDVLLEVKDRLPLHVGFDFDNFGSPYIDYRRYRTTLTHDNLLGRDDILTFQYLTSEGENYRLLILRYLFPLKQGLKLGLFSADSKIDLRHEYEDEDLNGRGKSRLYTIFAAQDLIDSENKYLVLNTGFDYKDTFNFQGGDETSRDRMRVARLSLDWDASDAWGRTIITDEISFGIPSIMAGLKKKDTRASRSGSGGKFWKNNLNLLRLHKMPFNSTFLWKTQLQFTPYILTAAEQFQTGGIINVRAYPPAELVGDKGYSMVWEWSFPPYFIAKDLRFPFSKAKIRDALRFIAFYDWSNTRLYRPTAREETSDTLRGTGCGLRINLPEDFSLRVEVAWPLDRTPSDSDNVRTLTEISKSF